MQLALTLNPFQDANLLFAQQLGANQIVADVPEWDTATLSAACNRIRQSGLQVAGVECLPPARYAQAIMGQAGRDEEIAEVCRIIADLGQLRVPMLGYRWTLAAEGDSASVTGRGGVTSAVYPAGNGATEDTDGQLWENLAYFMQRVLPAAEQAGVRLAYQAGLPTTSAAEARALDSAAGLERLFALAPSAYHGLDLDHGLFAGMSDDEVAGIIRRWGQRILAVRVRYLERTTDGLQERFLDENRLALFRALQAYQQVGFRGPLRPARTPEMADDSCWGHKGRAFSLGYLRAMLQAIG
ncbi:MAG: hypothetical protein GX552_06825 [Chloroflexi bacterium]|jgi:mannonate dehydratase|nr:hypothetical protein [Chloroflexota bacterium]